MKTNYPWPQVEQPRLFSGRTFRLWFSTPSRVRWITYSDATPIGFHTFGGKPVWRRNFWGPVVEGHFRFWGACPEEHRIPGDEFEHHLAEALVGSEGKATS